MFFKIRVLSLWMPIFSDPKIKNRRFSVFQFWSPLGPSCSTVEQLYTLQEAMAFYQKYLGKHFASGSWSSTVCVNPYHYETNCARNSQPEMRPQPSAQTDYPSNSYSN